MGRNREFDIDEALQRAMEAFWTRGYADTSIRDLVDCMGIKRGSLYAAFGDKETLFREAFRRYDRRRRAAMARDLPPLTAIRRWFRRLVDDAVSETGQRGCLIVNSALEAAVHGPATRADVAACLADIEAFFHERLQEARAAGDVDRELDPRRTAQAMLAAVIGIRVLSRVRPERTLLENIADAALAPIERAPTPQTHGSHARGGSR